MHCSLMHSSTIRVSARKVCHFVKKGDFLLVGNHYKKIFRGLHNVIITIRMQKICRGVRID